MSIVLVPGIVAGIALGLAFTLLNVFTTGMSYGTQEMLGLLVMLAAVAAGQVFALRKHPLGTAAPYPARYFTAMLAGAATALAFGIFMWFYFAVVNTDYLPAFYADYLARAREMANGEGGEAIMANAERMKGFILDPMSQAMVQFGTTLLIGLLAAIATAALVRPRPRGGESQS